MRTLGTSRVETRAVFTGFSRFPDPSPLSLSPLSRLVKKNLGFPVMAVFTNPKTLQFSVVCRFGSPTLAPCQRLSPPSALVMLSHRSLTAPLHWNWCPCILPVYKGVTRSSFSPPVSVVPLPCLLSPTISRLFLFLCYTCSCTLTGIRHHP